MHIAALAVSLKVPVKKLEALESDRFDLLPDAVFVRALSSSVCRTLKVDPAPILALLPQTLAPRLAQTTSGINTPFRAPSDGPGPSLWDQMSRPAVLAVLALLLGAVVLIFLPDIQRHSGLGGISRTESADAGTVPVPVVATSAETVVVNPPVIEPSITSSGPAGTAATSASGPVDNMPKVMAAAPPVTTPAAVSVASSSAPAAVAAGAPVASALAPTVQGAATGVVTFKADGPSWVEVTDARGAVPLRKILVAGEAAGASGALPLTVIVGRADATHVQVRGKVLNLAPLSRDNVARFEVK